MTATGLPRSLAPCFQEYDLERIDPAQHADLVIERVLAYGDRRELMWPFGYYGHARVTDWVQRMGARRLPWRRYNLWCVLLSLPPRSPASPRVSTDMALLDPVHCKSVTSVRPGWRSGRSDVEWRSSLEPSSKIVTGLKNC
jgi:hypothetical protein